MVHDTPLLVRLMTLIDDPPLAAAGPQGRGRPAVYGDRLFLKALVVMVVRPLSTVHGLLAVRAEPEMAPLRARLTLAGATRRAGRGVAPGRPARHAAGAARRDGMHRVRTAGDQPQAGIEVLHLHGMRDPSLELIDATRAGTVLEDRVQGVDIPVGAMPCQHVPGAWLPRGGTLSRSV